MNLVRQHPAYRADFLATMREHLQNSVMLLAVAVGPVVETKKKKADGDNTSVKRKRRHKTKYRATRSRKR